VSAPPPRAFIAAEAMDTLLAAHAAAHGGPKEPCGLMLGKSEAGRILVSEIRVLENVHANPDRAFLLPAAGAVAAARSARERSLTVVGVWHGHLRGPARLSESDAAGLASASRSSEGKAVESPYVFLVSGEGVGRTRVVRAFVHQRARPREVRLDVELPIRA
jgi:proteasome lid subunit RPN8/RPN11